MPEKSQERAHAVALYSVGPRRFLCRSRNILRQTPCGNGIQDQTFVRHARLSNKAFSWLRYHSPVQGRKYKVPENERRDCVSGRLCHVLCTFLFGATYGFSLSIIIHCEWHMETISVCP